MSWTFLAWMVGAVALAAWNFYPAGPMGKRWQALTLVSLTLLALGWVSVSLPWSGRFMGLFVDLLGLGLAGGAFAWLANKPVRFPLAIGLVVGLAAAKSLVLPVNTPLSLEGLDSHGEWLLEVRNPADLAALQAWAAPREITVTAAFKPADATATELDDYYILDLPSTASHRYATWQAELEASPWVDWLEPNELITVTPLPTRTLPDINHKLGVNDPDASQQWALQALHVEELYRLLDGVRPQRQARIAILDTGVDSKHEDLAANYFSVRKSYDDDPKGHGTHCAGIAAAVTNNGKGIAGLTRNNAYVQVTSIKVLGANGMGTQKGIIDGILEAADQGVDVISLSLGGFSNQAKQRAYNQAVAYAQRKGAIVVAAAGNFNRNAAGFAPANAEGVIAVSAIDQEGNRAAFSNYINDLSMGLAAPGVAIHSTIPGHKYTAFNGTSMAAPYVSGVIGLLRSLRPSLTTAQAYNLLRSTAKATDRKSVV